MEGQNRLHIITRHSGWQNDWTSWANLFNLVFYGSGWPNKIFFFIKLKTFFFFILKLFFGRPICQPSNPSRHKPFSLFLLLLACQPTNSGWGRAWFLTCFPNPTCLVLFYADWFGGGGQGVIDWSILPPLLDIWF